MQNHAWYFPRHDCVEMKLDVKNQLDFVAAGQKHDSKFVSIFMTEMFKNEDFSNKSLTGKKSKTGAPTVAIDGNLKSLLFGKFFLVIKIVVYMF